MKLRTFGLAAVCLAFAAACSSASDSALLSGAAVPDQAEPDYQIEAQLTASGVTDVRLYTVPATGPLKLAATYATCAREADQNNPTAAVEVCSDATLRLEFVNPIHATGAYTALLSRLQKTHELARTFSCRKSGQALQCVQAGYEARPANAPNGAHTSVGVSN